MRKEFRVDFPTFDWICSQVRSRQQGRHTNMREPVSVEKKVAMVLDILGNGKPTYQASKNVGVAESTCRKWFKPTLQAIIQVIGPRVIQFPRGEILKEVMDQW